MSATSFQFKQFTVHHDRCAMKVGTDGVLLGAWASVKGVRRILDVGTGTGLIALQLAQRTAHPDDGHSAVRIVAVEIDPAAAQQAAENVARSPWGDRVDVLCQDFRDYVSDEKFDLIVSNPPYFVDAMKCPDEQRRKARHTDDLSFDLLFQRSARLLSGQGTVSIIIPAEAERAVRDAAWRHSLHPIRRVQVFTKPGKPCRRLLLAFALHPLPCQEETICIEAAHGGYTPEYIALTRDFYLFKAGGEVTRLSGNEVTR